MHVNATRWSEGKGGRSSSQTGRKTKRYRVRFSYRLAAFLILERTPEPFRKPTRSIDGAMNRTRDHNHPIPILDTFFGFRLFSAFMLKHMGREPLRFVG